MADWALEMRREWAAYCVYGIPFASDFAFRTPLTRVEASPEFRFSCTEAAIEIPERAVCRYTSHRRTAEGQPVLSLFVDGNCEYFVLPGGECFRWEGDRIEVFVPDPEQTAVAEIFFLGTLLAYVLERRGIPVLHASTVRVDGVAAAFLAGSGGGKSSLAAGCVQAGFPLVSDDLLPLREANGVYTAASGYPQVRFWPVEARAFAGEEQRFERVHPDLEKLRVPVGAGGFGKFWAGDVPLGAIYIPERQPAGQAPLPVEIAPVSAPEAVANLARQLFLAPMLTDLGMMGERLRLLAKGVGSVPVRKLRYPSGLEHLPAVCTAVQADLEPRR